MHPKGARGLAAPTTPTPHTLQPKGGGLQNNKGGGWRSPLAVYIFLQVFNTLHLDNPETSVLLNKLYFSRIKMITQKMFGSMQGQQILFVCFQLSIVV